MSRGIVLAAVQGAPYPGTRELALEGLLGRVRELGARGADLVVLPELMAVPYFCCLDDPAYGELAEPLDGPTVAACSAAAVEAGTAVVATLFERRRQGGYANTAVLLDRRGGLAGVYRKCHLPRISSPTLTTDEKRWFTPGERLGVFDLDGVRVGILICYDRSFPEAWRVLMLAGAEVVAIPVATYGFRREAFRRELAVMAQQSHVFAVAANKAGAEQLPGEPQPRVHFGLSCIVDPFGELLAAAGEEPLEAISAETDLDRMAEARRLLDWEGDRRPDLYGPVAAPG
jgi:N-carbamoylputrescine amidase